MFSLIKYNHHDSRGMRVWRTTSTASQLHRSFAACSVARGFPGGSDRQESACSAGDPGSIPGFGRSPGEENGNPLQYSCLENSMDRKAWRATISPWGCKELDSTKHAHFLFPTFIFILIAYSLWCLPKD